MMIQEKKIRSLFFIIAFLFITNVVLLAFLMFNGNNDHSSHRRDARSVIETFLQDQMGFDAQQMGIYQNMRKADFEKRAPILDSLKIEKNKFYTHIYNDSVPDSVINKLALIVSKKQMAVDRHMFQYFKSVRRICTVRQLPKFDSSFKGIVEKITELKFRTRRLDKP